MASFIFNTTRQPRSGKRERKTVSSAAVQLTATAYTISATAAANQYANSDKLPSAAVLQVFTDIIIWTIDGTTPAAVTGFESGPGDFIYLDSFQKVKEFRAIRKTTDAAVEAVYLYGN